MTRPDEHGESDAIPVVEVTITGRGGGITYREGDRRIEFDWEFAMAPVVALVWGPKCAGWDSRYPWAAGRQSAIYDFVGAEVVRQKASGGAHECDLELGELTILSPTSARARGFHIAEAAAAAEELRRHVSLDARLMAAEDMVRSERLPSLEPILAREIRRLSRPQDGLERALRLASDHPSETIRQALLWASYNATECAPPCAAQLLEMTGSATRPFDADVQQTLSRLGKHNSSFDRSDAFADLSKRVGMVLDQSVQD